MERIKTSNFSRMFPNTCIIGETTPSFKETEPLVKNEDEDKEPSLFFPSLFEFYQITAILDEKVPPVAVYLSPQIMETVSKDEKSSVMLNFLLQKSFAEDIQIFLHASAIEAIPDFVWMHCPRVFYENRTPIVFATVKPKVAIARLLHFFSYDKDWTPELSYRLSKAVYSILYQRDIQDEEEYSEEKFTKELSSFYPIPFLFDKEKETILKDTIVSLCRTFVLYTKEKKAFLLKRTHKKLTFEEALQQEGNPAYLEASKAQKMARKAIENYKEEMNTTVI